MKQIRKYIVIFILFLLFMMCILFYFINKYNNTHMLNKAKYLLEELYSLKEGNYYFKNGFIYTKDNSLLKEKNFFDGNGKIQVDKYGNVRFNIESGNKCLYKTYLGNTSIGDECNEFETVKVNVSKNNSIISFITNQKDLEYKISKSNNFKGKWVKEEYNGNIILKKYNIGKNYIWFKDNKGNISNTIEFNVECLDTKDAIYNKNVFYCSGSIVKFNNEYWVVLEDKEDSVKLMKKDALDNKMPMCLDHKDALCYYNESDSNSLSWSKSYVNYYLNNVYINVFPDDIRNNLINMEICDDYDSLNCDGSSCGGYIKDEIDDNEWYCKDYTNSYIKVISYNEFNYVYLNSKNKSSVKGNYYAINSYINNFASSIQNNYEFYILENPTSELSVKPVIIYKKQ